MSAWFWIVVAASALKCAGAIGLVLAGGSPADPSAFPYSTYQYSFLILAFSATGLTLIAARTMDQRAVWLAGILVVTPVPFAETLLGCCAGAGSWTASAARLLEQTPVVPLLPVFFWLFVRDFPDITASNAGARVPRVAIEVSLTAGLLLIGSNLSEHLWPLRGLSVSDDARALLSRRTVESFYWPLIIGISLPGLAFLAWKTRTAKLADRRRVRMFAVGLLIGFVPVSLEVLLEALIPAYARVVTTTRAQDLITRLIFLSLAAVPLVTAYSVMVDRVVEIRLVIRSALQYALAKYTLLALIAVPLAGAAWYLYRHRDQTLLTLISGTGPLLLGATVVAAAVTLRIRHRALNGLDRRFFREQYDARQILIELADRCRKAATIDELVLLVCRDVDRALHLDYVTVLIATSDGSVLRSPDGRIRPLSRSSGLALLAQGDTAPLVIDLDSADSTLRRLPEEERSWLGDAGFGLLVPLNANDGSLQGLISLGHKLSELPFSREDQLLLEAIGTSVALTIENRRLRESAAPAHGPGRAKTPHPDPRADDGRPAKECDDCGRVYAPDTANCDCGNALDSSLVPYVLGGKFQFDRRLGSGGMGVVYRALDLDLGRHVAIKTLPHVRPQDAAHLRHEAKAMAAVQHENLAMIFGAESWLGTPMLVVELLAGGTLAALLRKGPLPVARALDISIAIARGVEHLHRAGLLHCDIKPSNIGFTRDETPKLLDFGLATILLESTTSGSTTTRSAAPADQRQFAGTPLYMSPEALDGQAPRPACDVWSLSVVLFETIAGAPPFRAGSVAGIADAVKTAALPDIRASNPSCPAPVANFFSRALSRRAHDRPPTAAHLGAELARLRECLRQE